MSFFSISGGGTSEDLQTRINNNRLANATAFQTMVSAKKANGENVDPAEIYRWKMSLSGGDPGAASLMPADDAINAMAKQANEGAEASRQSISLSIAQSAKQRQDLIQGIVDAQPHASLEEFNQNLLGVFGPETGAKFATMYTPIFNSMKTESQLRLSKTIAENPMFQHVTDEASAQRFLPNEWNDTRMKPIIKSMISDQAFTKSEKVRTATLDTLSRAPEALAMAPAEEQRKFFQAMAPAGQADRAMSGYHAVTLGSENARMAKMAENARTDPATAAWINTATSDEELTNIAKLLLTSQGITVTDDNDPRLLAFKGNLKVADMANDSIKYEAAMTQAKVDAMKITQQEEKTNQETYASAKATEVVAPATKNNKENAYKSTLAATQALFGKDGEGGIVHASKSNMDMWFAYLQNNSFDPNKVNAATFIDPFVTSSKANLETRQDVITRRAEMQVETTLGPAPQPAQRYIENKQKDINQLTSSYDNAIKRIDERAESAFSKNQRKAVAAQKALSALETHLMNLEGTLQDPIKSRNLHDRNPALEAALGQTLSDAISKIRLSQTVDATTGNSTASGVGPINPVAMAEKMVAARQATEDARRAFIQDLGLARQELQAAYENMSKLNYPSDVRSSVMEQAYSETMNAVATKHGVTPEEASSEYHNMVYRSK